MIEDVLPELSKARVFTKVDAGSGYWHVALDEESAKLTMFIILKCTEFPYLARVVTKEGLKPDLDKIKAVQKMLRLDNIIQIPRRNASTVYVLGRSSRFYQHEDY